MKAFDAYKMYVAIKLHFQTDYDYFKFSGKARASRESFEHRKDRHIFEKLVKIYDADQYQLLLVSNFIHKPDVWIGDIASEQGRQRYLELKKKMQSIQHTFKQDVARIKSDIEANVVDSFDGLFRMTDDCWPHLVSMMTQHDISIETFIIMNKILNFLPKMSKVITDDIVWPEICRLITKYSPFIRVDLKPFREILKKEFVTDAPTKTLARRD